MVVLSAVAVVDVELDPLRLFDVVDRPIAKPDPDRRDSYTSSHNDCRRSESHTHIPAWPTITSTEDSAVHRASRGQMSTEVDSTGTRHGE